MTVFINTQNLSDLQQMRSLDPYLKANSNFNKLSNEFDKLFISEISQINQPDSTKIKQYNSSAAIENNLAPLENYLIDIKKTLISSEKVMLRSLQGDKTISEADVVIKSIEAKNKIDVATELRNKFQESIDKVFNINF